MKAITCDRCGKEIPYVPSFMNAARQGIIPPKLIMTIWDAQNMRAREVDLCDDCEYDVYNYIFCYKVKDNV